MSDPAAALVRVFDRLVADESTPTRRIERLADRITKLRESTPPPPPAPAPRRKPSGPKVTLTRQHLCPYIDPRSDYRGTLRWLGDDDVSQPCDGCGATQGRT